jgi:nicotinate phosphoribosyltransferase
VDPQQLINRLAYGIGTRLITSSGASALDGVYKLVTVKDKGIWIPTMKISESPEKTLNPGNKTIWRIYDPSGKAISDLISLAEENPSDLDVLALHHPTDQSKSRILNRDQVSEVESLNQEILKDGKVIYQFPSIEEIRKIRQKDTDRLYPGVKRLINPHIYHVSLSQKLWELKQNLMQKTKG